MWTVSPNSSALHRLVPFALVANLPVDGGRWAGSPRVVNLRMRLMALTTAACVR